MSRQYIFCGGRADRVVRLGFAATLAACLLVAGPTLAAEPRDDARIKADGMAALKEVMRACGLNRVAHATLFIAGPVPMDKISTVAQDEAYANSEIVFQKTVSGNSPCWTRERFRRYVLGVLQTRRELAQKITPTHASTP